MRNTLMGYAYDSHLSYLDHLRIADSARRAGAVAGEAAERGAWRVEAGIAAAATQITDAVNDVSLEVRAAREVMEWGFSATINELVGMRATLQELKQYARTPSQTWAYEQFEIARENFRKGNYEDCLKRLDYGIGGFQSNLGYPEGWQLHQLKGDIYLQCPKRELIDLPKAEECFLAAAKYADTSHERAMALTAAAVAAYNQGRMELAENYAQQACKARRQMADAHFQLARIRLNRRNYSEAWQAALQAMTLDHRYAARLPLDSEFERNVEQINPTWRQYGEKLKAPLEAAVQTAAVTLRKLAKSQAETKRMRNSRAFELLDLAGNGLVEAKARFQKMTELANTLSPEAEKALKLLKNRLQEDSVFAFLEAESEAQRVNDLATGALAASREGEFTLRKVEQLSHGLPDSFPIPFSSIFSSEKVNHLILFFGLFWCLLISGAFITGVYNAIDTEDLLGKIIGFFIMWVITVVPVLGGFVVLCRNFFRREKEEATKKGIESFDWGAANKPQTTLETDGTILRANKALQEGDVQDDEFDEFDEMISNTIQGGGRKKPFDGFDLDSLDDRIVSFLRNGKKIEAITLYRKETGCDLQTGKSYVESLAFEHDIF